MVTHTHTHTHTHTYIYIYQGEINIRTYENLFMHLLYKDIFNEYVYINLVYN